MIRNIFFLFSIIYINSFNNFLFSQETWEQDSSWVAERNAIIQEINTIFSNLDNTKLSTGFLYDRVPLPVSGISNYNGLTDSVLDSEKWLQLYYELTQYASTTD